QSLEADHRRVHRDTATRAAGSARRSRRTAAGRRGRCRRQASARHRPGRDRPRVRARVGDPAPQRSRDHPRHVRGNPIRGHEPDQGGPGSDQLTSMLSTSTSTPPQTVAAPFQDLVEESFDEAAFLWRRWENELVSLTRNLDEVWSWTEDRLHGALDGVRVGGASTLDLAKDALATDEIDKIAVSTA